MSVYLKNQYRDYVKRSKLQTHLENQKDNLYFKSQWFQTKMEVLQKQRQQINDNQNELTEKLNFLYIFAYKNQQKIKRSYDMILRERQIQEQAEKELLACGTEIGFLITRKEHLQNINNRLRQYEDFIKEAINLLPIDYVKTKKSNSVDGLMGRFNSLFRVSEVLFELLLKTGDQIKDMENTLNQLFIEKMDQFVQLDTEFLSSIRKDDKLSSTLTNFTFKYYKSYIETRQKVHEFGVILLSLDNITNMSMYQYKYFTPKNMDFNHTNDIKTMTVVEKLEKIFDFMQASILLISEVGNVKTLQEMGVNESCMDNVGITYPDFR